jgi:hypothetical protein
MTKAKVIGAILVIVLVGVFAYAVRSGHFEQALALVSPRAVLDYPSVVDIGELERGKAVEVHFKLANRGDAPLSIEDGGASCACLGLIEFVNGQWVRMDPFVLEPGQEREVTTRLQVRGQTGKSFRELVRVRTNDPDNRLATIEILINKVRGGLLASPESAVFGTVPIGEERRQVIELRDDRVPPRKVESVSSTNPDHFTARLLAIEPEATFEESEAGHLTLVARVEILLRTNDSVDLFGGIEVRLAGDNRAPDVIPVLGRVAAPVELSPSVLVLPRRSRSGKLYHADCVCRTTQGQPLTLETEAVPAGLVVTLFPAGTNTGTRKLRVEWSPTKAGKTASELSHFVRLRAS